MISEKAATAVIATFLEIAAERGWRLVPDEATKEMVNSASEAGYHSSDSDKWSDRELAREYRAMLAVAPKFKVDGLRNIQGGGE